jgi:hypothetical protein
MHERVLSKVILSIFRFNSLGINEMNEELEVQIRKALESSWSDKTSFCYSPEFPMDNALKQRLLSGKNLEVRYSKREVGRKMVSTFIIA